MVTKLILIRHGETHANAGKIVQGHLNSQLNEKGIEQAKKLALRLKDEKIDLCYSSDLDRCLDTAKEIVKFHPNLEIIPKKDLREQNKGTLTGKTREERDAAQKAMGIPYYQWDFNGGENAFEVSKRVINFIKLLLNENENKNILISTHGGPINAHLLYVNKIPIESDKFFLVKNTAITEIEFKDGEAEVKTLHCDKHLI